MDEKSMKEKLAEEIIDKTFYAKGFEKELAHFLIFIRKDERILAEIPVHGRKDEKKFFNPAIRFLIKRYNAERFIELKAKLNKEKRKEIKEIKEQNGNVGQIEEETSESEAFD